MRKYLIEQTLQGEMDTYLGYARYERHSSINSRNGSSKKTITTEKRPIAISVPRDLEAGSSSKLSPSNKPERECLMTKSLPEFGANGQITKELAPLGSEYTFEEILNTLQTVQALTSRDGKMQMMEVTKRQHEVVRRGQCF